MLQHTVKETPRDPHFQVQWAFILKKMLIFYGSIQQMRNPIFSHGVLGHFYFLQLFHTDRDNLCKLLMLLKISKMEDIIWQIVDTFQA
jgi:hypothetical protein